MSEDAETKYLPDAFKKRRSSRKVQRDAGAESGQFSFAAVTEDTAPDTGSETELTPAGYDGGDYDPVGENEVEQRTNSGSASFANSVLDAKIDRLLDSLQALQRENAELKRQLSDKGKAEQTARKPRIEINVGDAEIDEKEIAEQFPTLLPTVRAVARKEVKAALEALAPQLERLFSETDEVVGSVVENAKKSARSSFERDLYNRIPDFDAINRSQAFQDYIDGKAPLQPKGVTIRAVLSHAWNDMDADTIVEIIGTYKDKHQPSAVVRGRKADVNEFVQPATPRGQAAQARNPANSGKLRMSDLKKERERLLRGELTAAEFSQIRSKFDKAKSEGRLVDDTAAPAGYA